MNQTQLLVGSLSNDLYRVAVLTQRGSMVAARQFVDEAKRWAEPLQQTEVADYIKTIAREVAAQRGDISLELAETYLMYGILLQNYVLHAMID